jgi:hypothetical protein
MAYYDIALLSSDSDFLNRCTACASTESIPEPKSWVIENQWNLASTPSFGDKYAYAIASEVPNPGRDESVISDGEILSAVQSLMNPPA